MIGPPGAGKSILALLHGLLPDLTPMEAHEVSMVRSVTGILEGPLFTSVRCFGSRFIRPLRWR
jgi:predicted ATPase with chaperone activity